MTFARIEKLEEAPEESDGSPWDYERDGKIWKSCAVVATDGKGNDVLLHAFGPAIDWHVDQYGYSCDAVCLTGHGEPGVWVFEGTVGSYCYDTMDGREWDLEARGTWREPTSEEWDHIKEGECPWTRETLPRWSTAPADTGSVLLDDPRTRQG
jgi:hypothetical protein